MIKATTMKRQFINQRSISSILVVVFFFLSSTNSFSQGLVGKDEALTDSISNKIISDFLIAGIEICKVTYLMIIILLHTLARKHTHAHTPLRATV